MCLRKRVAMKQLSEVLFLATVVAVIAHNVLLHTSVDRLSKRIDELAIQVQGSLDTQSALINQTAAVIRVARSRGLNIEISELTNTKYAE